MSKDFSKIGDVLKHFDSGEDKYISQEFQKYGYDLAAELSDLKHKALYIKLAKTTPRGLLETARSFVKDAANVKNKGALFMWKLKEIKRGKLPPMAAELVQVHVFIEGRVQGVFFRFWIKKEAEKLGLTGWVKNTSDGSVEAVFQGKKEKVEKMLEKCHQGPPVAKVQKIEIKKQKVKNSLNDFDIRYQ